jgi:hypothetical protein
MIDSIIETVEDDVTIGYRGGDGCRPSEDSDGRRHLSIAPDGRGQ